MSESKKVQEIDLYHAVADIEENYPVNELVYQGVHLWPWVRASVRDAYLINQRKLSGAKQPKSKLFGLSEFLGSIKTLLTLRGSDICVLSNVGAHSDKKEGLRYDRIGDPAISYWINNYQLTVSKITYGKSFINDATYHPLNFLDLRYFTNPFKYLRVKREVIQLIAQVKYFSILEQKTGLDFIGVFVKSVAFVFATQSIARYILKKTRAKSIAFVCYYFNVNFSYLLAAKKLKIPTLDIQHGKQGIFHLMYTNWSKVPNEGYDLIPDYFWTWGANSSKNLLKGRLGDVKIHQPIEIGNFWLNQWKANPDYQLNSSFENKVSGYTYVVLFSLQQAMEEPIPGFILDKIKQTESDTLWLLRLHPAQSASSPRIYEMVAKLGVGNVDIEASSELPLYQLLDLSSFHITNFSSVCIEALNFGVSSIIVHPNGIDLYQSLIESGDFFKASNTLEFDIAFETIKSSSVKTNIQEHFLMDEESIKNNMDTLLHQMNVLD